MAVSVPVTDLRAQPHTNPQPGVHDPLQETQLLYGERVRILAVEDGWARVEALEQPEFTHALRWQGYPGWLKVSVLQPWQALRDPTIVVTEKWASAWREPQLLTPVPWRFPLGTRLRATPMGGQRWKVELLDGTVVWMSRGDADALLTLRARTPLEQRRAILRNASLFIGDAYLWGGRSPVGVTGAEQGTGVDCSGLVNLAYRAAGLDIPRDAHEQFLHATPVRAPQPADLLFLSERHNPAHIVHVMLYAGDGMLIEGPGTGQAIRRIAVAERLGQPLDWLASGVVIDNQTISFGSYLP